MLGPEALAIEFGIVCFHFTRWFGCHCLIGSSCSSRTVMVLFSAIDSTKANNKTFMWSILYPFLRFDLENSHIRFGILGSVSLIK